MYTHEQKRADSWEACSHDYSNVGKEPAGVTKRSQNNLKDGGKGIKVNKHAHQRKNDFVALDTKEDLGEVLVL